MKKISLSPISSIINEAKKGKIFILVDNKNRETETIEARATCYTIMRKEFHMGYTEIGKHFLKKHATIMHGIKEYPYMIKFKPTEQRNCPLSDVGYPILKNSVAIFSSCLISLAYYCQ